MFSSSSTLFITIDNVNTVCGALRRSAHMYTCRGSLTNSNGRLVTLVNQSILHITHHTLHTVTLLSPQCYKL